MPVTRSTLNGGPAHIAYAGVNIHMADDSSLKIPKSWKVREAQSFGEVDSVNDDLIMIAEGTPLTFESLAVLLPHCVPAIGARVPGDVDVPLQYLCSNRQRYTLVNACVVEMPEIILGVGEPVFGRMKFAGLVGDGMDPSDDNSYYTIDEADYVPAAVDKTKIPSGEYVAAWGTRAGFAEFQAKDKWRIQHELKLVRIPVQSRTRCYKIKSYRVMARCTPVGPSDAQIDAQLRAQGSGAGNGHRMSDDIDDLVITGAGVSVTLKNTGIQEAGFEFGVEPLRIGEVGWITVVDTSSGIWAGGLVLASS